MQNKNLNVRYAMSQCERFTALSQSYLNQVDSILPILDNSTRSLSRTYVDELD